jgi:hypothetical protein
MPYKAGDACPCCDCKMTAEQARMATAYENEEENGDGPEVEVSIEGDPDSVRSILNKLMPK